MNALKTLLEHGQSPWMDYLRRDMLKDGRLKAMIEEDGVRGLTSNPSIFQKAIAAGDDYDDAIRAIVDAKNPGVTELFEDLAVEDIRAAADIFKPVYDESDGRDGFVSLEVSPYLALDTEATIEEARRLWGAVERPNLMVKVPATEQGLPAIRTLIGEGINVNITLLFAQSVYEQVVEAYMAGLEALAERGGDPSRVASVASFFVSRIDAAVDKLIDAKAKEAAPGERETLEGLRGKTAIANAKMAYQIYRRLHQSERWANLGEKGARPQRLLWASTGMKNPDLPDTLYVDELIGPDTVNTLPPPTMDAERDHGRPRPNSLDEGLDDARATLAALKEAGVDLDDVTKKLVEDGVRLFADAADELYAAVEMKRQAVARGGFNAQSHQLPGPLDEAVEKTLAEWRSSGAVRRLWRGDAGLWTGGDEAKWLGWLHAVGHGRESLPELKAFAEEVRRGGYGDVVLIGMGGSSLGPEVLANAIGSAEGFPRLRIIDSTDPEQIRRLEADVDLGRTLFIVSSKSGGTLEPNILKDYFFARAGAGGSGLLDRVKEAVGLGSADAGKPGERFVAVTDPGSSMEEAARRDGFARVFHGEPTIGGRYSVLSNFGLVPAAAMGIDLHRLLDGANAMTHACGAGTPPAANPGVLLGVVLGTAAKQGRDKVTIVASPGIKDLGAWLEQLIAESTGKEGKGLIPVDGETVAPPEAYGDDRVFAYLRLNDAADPEQERAVKALEGAGQPVIRIEVGDAYAVAQEFFRWEIATAVAGSVIGINPFDQPDVEASKVATRELTEAVRTDGALPEDKPLFEDGGIAVHADDANAEQLRAGGGGDKLAEVLRSHFRRLEPGDYAAILAYVARDDANAEALQAMRLKLRDAKKVATCVGFGPRFLHSTGQAYKGGPNTGVFLQITTEHADDIDVPGRGYGFALVEAAQARGDLQVLSERGRRALRLHVKGPTAEGLRTIASALDEALA